MKYEYLTEKHINEFIDLALQEDVGDGDHSSLAAVPPKTVERAKLIIKGNGIIAGVEMARCILHRVDADMDIEFLVMDGQPVRYGDIGFYVSGNAQTILKAERLVLNCMQRMSGIATLTHELVNKIKHTHAKLLDTRKTTPNFRLAEKWAVKIGGGTNHRYGLFDMIMLKDNHIDYAGGITQAIRQTQAYLQDTGKDLKIEIETRNLAEVEEVLQVGGVEVIMLDNFSLDELNQALTLINHQFKTEASGGITPETIVPIAETGVDFISMGSLTHSIQSMDISLKAVR